MTCRGGSSSHQAEPRLYFYFREGSGERFFQHRFSVNPLVSPSDGIMPASGLTSDSSSTDRRYLLWLRVLKLVLTVILLAIGIWQALAGGSVPAP